MPIGRICAGGARSTKIGRPTLGTGERRRARSGGGTAVRAYGEEDIGSVLANRGFPDRGCDARLRDRMDARGARSQGAPSEVPPSRRGRGASRRTRPPAHGAACRARASQADSKSSLVELRVAGRRSRRTRARAGAGRGARQGAHRQAGAGAERSESGRAGSGRLHGRALGGTRPRRGLPPPGAGPGHAAVPLPGPEGEPDDLKRISGIGPGIEKTLHALGIYHFRQIAELTSDNVTWIDQRLRFKGASSARTGSARPAAGPRRGIDHVTAPAAGERLIFRRGRGYSFAVGPLEIP